MLSSVVGLTFLGSMLMVLPIDLVCKEYNEPCKPLEYTVLDHRVNSKQVTENRNVVLPLCN